MFTSIITKIKNSSISTAFLTAMVMCLFGISAYGQDPLPKEAPTSVRSVRSRQHKQRQHDIRETDSLCVIAMKRKYMHKIWYSRPFVTLYERFEPIEVIDICMR